MNIDQAFAFNEQSLRFRVARTEVLASNLANVNTPGYLAKDVEFKDVFSAANTEISLQKRIEQEYRYRVPQQNSRDGNTVELGVEQAKFAENQMDFQMSLTFFNMKLSGIKKVLEAG